jgi:hypothetical protein
MIKLIFAFLFLTCSLSADKYNSEHVCVRLEGTKLDTQEEILAHWSMIQDMRRHPDLEKTLSIMNRCKDLAEESVGLTLDLESHLQLVFNYLHIMKIDISPAHAKVIQKIILRKSMKSFRKSDLPKLVPVGIAVAMCGIYINYIPSGKYQEICGDTIIAYGMHLVTIGYKND